jgi:hypothetical protein
VSYVLASSPYASWRRALRAFGSVAGIALLVQLAIDLLRRRRAS